MVAWHDEMFQVLGLSEAQERIFRMLLGTEQALLTDIIETTGLARREAKVGLADLESKALIVRSADRVPKYSVSSADLAVQSLLYRRGQEVEAAGGALIELVHDLRAERTDASEVVEILRGEGAISQWAYQLKAGAREEILFLSRPPYVLGTEPPDVERSQLRAGVRYRIIYDITAFDVRGHFGRIADDVAEGEEARVLADLPMKLIVSDRSVGLMTLNLEEPDVRAALVVRSSALLDALMVLFECLWEKAIPFNPQEPPTAGVKRREGGLADNDRRLVALLSTGMTDEAIAAQLGVTSRTLRRRLGRLSDEVGAKTRFQLGLVAGWNWWVEER